MRHYLPTTAVLLCMVGCGHSSGIFTYFDKQCPCPHDATVEKPPVCVPKRLGYAVKPQNARTLTHAAEDQGDSVSCVDNPEMILESIYFLSSIAFNAVLVLAVCSLCWRSQRKGIEQAQQYEKYQRQETMQEKKEHNLKQEKKVLEESLLACKNEKESLKSDNKKEISDLERKKKAEITELNKQMQREKEKYRNLNTKHDKYVKKYGEQEGASKEEQVSLQKRIGDLSSDLAHVKQQFNTACNQQNVLKKESEEKLTDARNEIMKLKSHISILQDEYSSKNEEVAQVAEKHKHEIESNTDLRQKINDLETSLESSNDVVEKLQTKLTILEEIAKGTKGVKQHIADLTATITTREHCIRKMQSDLDAKTSQCSKFKRDLSEEQQLLTKTKNALAQANSQIQDMSVHLEQFKQNEIYAEGQLQQVQIAKESAEAKVEVRDDKIATLRNERAQLEKHISEKTIEISDLNDKCQGLETKLSVTSQKLQNVEKEKLKLKSQLKGVDIALEETEDKLKKEQNKLSETQDKLSTCQSNLAQANERNETQSNDLQDVNANLTTETQNHEVTRKLLEREKQNHLSAKKELKSTTQSLEGTQKELESVSTELHKRTRQCKTLTEDLEKKKKDCNRLASDLKQENETLLSVEEKLTSTTTLYNDTVNKLKRKKEDLDHTRNLLAVKDDKISRASKWITQHVSPQYIVPRTAYEDERITPILAQLMNSVNKKISGAQFSIVPMAGPEIGIDVGSPVILPCVAASRVGSDINAALSKAKIGKSQVILIIFHHLAQHNCKISTATEDRLSDRTIQDQCVAIVDAVFWNGSMYDCAANTKAVDKIQQSMRWRVTLKSVQTLQDAIKE